MSVLLFLLARGKEASTYAGLGSLLVAAHLCTDCTSMSQYLTWIAMGACGVAAMFIPDKAK